MNSELDIQRIDLLISHVVDREATADEWHELETHAQAQPRLWRELAEAQRDGAALRGALRLAGDLADRTPLPARLMADHDDETVHVDARTLPHPTRGPQRLTLHRFGSWSGWLVAAMVALVALLRFADSPSTIPGANPAGLGVSLKDANPEQLREAYLTKGQAQGAVLGEMPGKMMVEMRPGPDGQGYEVIYLRQIIERTVVPDMYQITGTDERGQPTLTRFRTPARKTM